MSTGSEIAKKAYELWLLRGDAAGSADEDWYQAERLIGAKAPSEGAPSVVDESTAESFPASDPPSTHVADEPPRNAGDKWEAARAARLG